MKIDKAAIVGSIATLLLGLLYYGSYICHTFPFTEGWGINYVTLMESGRMPYRDFYFYLPPFNLFMDSWLWDLSGHSFLGFRILRLFERILFFQVYYWVLVRYYKPFVVSIACIAGTIFCGADPYDLMGDYTQTAIFCVLMVSIAFLVFERASTIRRKLLAVGFAGFFAGIAIMTKQPHGVAIGVVFGLYFVTRSIIHKDMAFIKYLYVGLVGFALPVVGLLWWLYDHGLIDAFVKCCFVDTGAKGSLFELLVLSPINSFNGIKSEVFEVNVIVIGVLVLYFLLMNREVVHWHMPTVLVVSALGILVLMPIWQGGFARLFWCCTPAAAVLFMTWIWRRDWNDDILIRIGYILISVMAVLIMFMLRFGYVNINRIASRYHLVVNSVCLIFFVSMLISVITLLIKKFRNYLPCHKYIFVLFLGCIANWYALVMSSRNSSLVAKQCYMTTPLIICLAMTILPKRGLIARRVLICIVITLFSCIIFARKVQCPYSWWGWVDSPIGKKVCQSENPRLSGFYFSSGEKQLFDGVLKTIEENSLETDDVFTFPHMPIYNLLSKRNCSIFVPVLFFDVCSDRYAEESAKWLRTHPPKIVVWGDIGMSGWNIHEEMYRGGRRSGQRDIQEWLYDMVRDGKYRMVGQCRQVFIYARVDYENEAFRYNLQDNEPENSTLKECALRRK